MRELFALFDVDTGAAEAKLTRLKGSTDLAKEGLAELAATAISAFSAHAVVGFVEDMIQLGSVLNDTSERLGVSTDELQKFQMAAQVSGVDTEEAAKALGFLNRNIGEALGGSKEAAQQFAQMGIQIKDQSGGVRELGDLLPEVADAFQAMGSDQERTANAMKLFGRSGAALIPLLKQGSGELKAMNDQFEALGLGITDDFIKKADAAGDQLDILKLGFRALKTRIAVEVLPGVTALAQKFQGWIGWAQGLVRETNIVKEVWAGLGIVAALASAKIVAGWAKITGLIPKGGSLFETLLGMGEIGFIIGGLVAVGLAIDDIVTMCQGGESVIGDFLDEFGGVGEKQELIDSLTQAWEEMQVPLAELGPLVKDIAVAFAHALPYMIGLVADLIKGIMTAGIELMGLGEFAAHLFAGHFDQLDRVGSETADKVANLWKGGSTFANMVQGPATISANDPALRAGANTREPSDFSRGDTNVQVTVNGGPSNEDTGRAVARGVEQGLTKADLRNAAAALAHGTP